MENTLCEIHFKPLRREKKRRRCRRCRVPEKHYIKLPKRCNAIYYVQCTPSL